MSFSFNPGKKINILNNTYSITKMRVQHILFWEAHNFVLILSNLWNTCAFYYLCNYYSLPLYTMISHWRLMHDSYPESLVCIYKCKVYYIILFSWPYYFIFLFKCYVDTLIFLGMLNWKLYPFALLISITHSVNNHCFSFIKSQSGLKHFHYPSCCF